MRDKNLKLSILAYFLIAPIIVLGNSFLCDFGFHTEYTISRYIGLSAWSAILFALTSLFIFVNFTRHLKTLKKAHGMSLIWWLIAVITSASLVGVGLCPVGYFDETFGDFGTVSILHRTFAFIMFCSSIPLTFLTALKFRKKTSFLVSSLIFVVFGLSFVFCYANSVSFFMNTILFSEAFFLAFFLLNLLLVPKSERSSKSKKKEESSPSAPENLDK